MPDPLMLPPINELSEKTQLELTNIHVKTVSFEWAMTTDCTGWIRLPSEVIQLPTENTFESTPLSGEWYSEKSNQSYRIIGSDENGIKVVVISELPSNETNENYPVLRETISILSNEQPNRQLNYVLYWGSKGNSSRLTRMAYRFIGNSIVEKNSQ